MFAQQVQKQKWRPQPDLNRCCRRERPMSWTWLDDGDANYPFSLDSVFIHPSRLFQDPVVPLKERGVLDLARRWGRLQRC